MKIKRQRRHFITGRTVACDTESTGLSTWAGDAPYMFSFASTAGDVCSFEFPVDPFTRRVKYEAKPKLHARLKRFFQDRSITKVFHNSKHDVRQIEYAGMPVRGPKGDTEFKLKICDSTRMSYELKPTCKELFGIGTDDQKKLHKATASLRPKAKKLGYKIATDETHGSKGKVAADAWLIQYAEEVLVGSLKFLKSFKGGTDATRRKMKRAAIEQAAGMKKLCKKYAEIDATRTIVLDAFLEDVLDEYEVRHIYEEELNDIWPVVYAIEGRGVFINREVAEVGKARAAKQVAAANKKIQRLCKVAKSKLNPDTFANSFPQKKKYFIDELKLEPLHYAKKTGNPKLDKTFLEHYADDNPMCGAIQRQGKGKKAIGTYFNNYLSEMDEAGIYHGNFQQIGTKTARFSARLLQQVPKRGKCAKCNEDLKIAGWKGELAICKKCGKATPLDILLEVRRPFGPRPGHVWYMMDFQQIEARIFADYANERFMLKSFAKGRDVYQDFADVIVEETGLPISRQDTKAIFLGKLYGLGLAKLIKSIIDAAHGLDVDEAAARSVIDCFDGSFPRVSEFMRETIAVAKDARAVYNRYGQRVDIRPPFFDPETGKTFDESYRGVNYIIQSSAARLMKRGMVRCHRFLQSLGFGWIVLTIHDELVFEFPADNRPRWVIQKLANLMSDNEGVFKRVATPVDVSKTTGSWLEPKPVEFVVSA